MYNKTDIIEFQNITNDTTFQDLLRDLIAEEDGILEANIYGRRGQKQYGIDILAPTIKHDYLTIQAKCYKKYTKTDLNTAYLDFKKYITRWENIGVRTFVIAVSCKVDDSKILDYVVELRKALWESSGIYLSFWDATIITSKLKNHRAIAQKYITNTSVVELLCGKDPTEQAAFLAFKERERLQTFSVQSQQWRDQQSRSEYQVLEQLIRSGCSRKALEQLNTITSANDWNTRSLASQASFLRLHAQLLLELEHDEIAARSAAETALLIDPAHEDGLFAIRLLLHQGLTDEALDLALNTKSDPARLQAAALLLNHDPQHAITLLEEVSDPEHFNALTRLKAIALSLLGQTDASLALIQNQARQTPDHFQLHLTWAQLSYFNVLSPALRHLERLQTVLPISQGLFQLNEQGIERLREAQKLTGELLQWQGIDSKMRDDAALLYLAALAQDPSPEGAFLATKFLKEEIRKNHLTPEQSLWAIHYGWKIDLEKYLPLFEQSENPNGPLVVIAWYEKQGRILEAFSTLRRHETLLRQRDEAVYYYWAERLQPPVPTSALSILTRALANGELACTQLDAFLEGTGELGDAVEVLRRSHPQALLERADRLLERLATPAVLFICVVLAVNHKNYPLAQRLWTEHAELVSGAVIPPQVRRTLSRLWFELGQLPEALQDAQLLLESEPCAAHEMHLIDLMVNMALTTDLRPHLEQLMTYVDLTVNHCLRAVRYARAIQDTRLGGRLLEAAAKRIQSDLDVEQVMIAQLTGGYPDLPKVRVRFQELMAQGKLRNVTIIKVEEFLAELPQFTDNYGVYQQGEVSIHHLHAGQPEALAAAYLAAHPQRPLYLRHGGITPAANDDLEHSSLKEVSRLALDLTSLLLGARLRVLDYLSAEFEITLATDHVHELTDMLADLPLTSVLREDIQQIMSWIRERQPLGGFFFKPSDEMRRYQHCAEILGFSALMTCTFDTSERLCVDDRWAQQIALRHGRLVTDMVSVLEELVRRERITVPEYYRLKQLMRQAQMFFLPLTSSELLYWLTQAEVPHGFLQETVDLTVIRQYYAGCFGAASALMPITLQDDDALHTGEVTFMLNYLHETRQALLEVFTISRTPEALANWLMDHLLIDMVAVARLPWGSHPHGRSVQNLRELELLSLASLDMHLPKEGKAAYYRWVNHKLIQPRLTLDTTLGERFVKIWKPYVLNLLPNEHDATARVALGLLVSEVETHLPFLHDAVTSDVQYMKSTGRNRIKLCLVHGRAFDMEKIWRVFLTLYGGRRKTARLSDQEDVEWTWSLVKAGEECHLQAVREGDGFQIRMQEVWLALGKRKDREAHLPEIMRALPGVQSSDARVQAMLREGKLTKRLEHFIFLKTSIPSFFYSGLSDDLAEQPLTQQTDRRKFLPADPLVALRVAGLEGLVSQPQVSVEEVVNQAASDMIQREGVVSAVRRFANLPVEMPTVLRETLHQEVSSLPELLDLIRGQGSSPVGLAHTVHYLKFVPGKEAKRLRRRLAARMFTPDYLHEMTALQRVLRWTFDLIFLTVPSWPVSALVAATWLHAGEIYQQLRQTGYEAESIWQFFDQDRTYLPLHALIQSPDAPSDVALPSDLVPQRMVILAFLHAAPDLMSAFEVALQKTTLARFEDKAIAPILKISLVGSDTSLSNHLNSFMGIQLESALTGLDWLPTDMLKPGAAEAIFNAQKMPEDQHAIMPTILYLAGQQKQNTSPVFSNGFCKTLLEFDASDWTGEVAMLGLIGAANLNNHVVDSLEEKLLYELGQYLRKVQPNRTVAFQTFEILTALIRHPVHRQHELQHLARLLDQIITPHTALRKIIFPVLVRFAFECPPEAASEFWPVLLRWRELSAQGELEWWAEGGEEQEPFEAM